MPTNYAVNTTGDESRRSYILNYNFIVQRDLGNNWSAQVGYVASRAARVSGRLNSRQTTITMRYSQGLQMSFAHTWSQAMGWCCNEDNNGGPLVPALAYTSLNYVPLNFDRTHNFQLTASYELPFGAGKKWAGGRVMNAIAGGWQINTLTSYMTCTPVRVTSDGGSLRLPGSTQRADQVKQDVARLNGFFNTDLGLFRQFSVKERYRFQFRDEMFNWTNTPRFASPSAGINNHLVNPDGSFRGGVFEITGTNPGRCIPRAGRSRFGYKES